MKRNKAVLLLCFAGITLNSCFFFPLAPKDHYFAATNSNEKDIPAVTIFSTPQSKSYIVTGVDMNSQVFISSPAFPDTARFYLMEQKDFFEKKVMQYEFARNDHKFYKNGRYKKLTLKLISRENERLIEYRIIQK